MQEQFSDRVLRCADCAGDFVFTAGEQLFFFDKQFKNDPKRCKPCKSRRSGLAAAANGLSAAKIAPRAETRTFCSDCGVETTVPFKPTQGRPVLCRQCFGKKTTPVMTRPAAQAVILAELSIESSGTMLSGDAALLAATSMTLARPNSSVATEAELASVADVKAADSSDQASFPARLEQLRSSDAFEPEFLQAGQPGTPFLA